MQKYFPCQQVLLLVFWCSNVVVQEYLLLCKDFVLQYLRCDSPVLILTFTGLFTSVKHLEKGQNTSFWALLVESPLHFVDSLFIFFLIYIREFLLVLKKRLKKKVNKVGVFLLAFPRWHVFENFLKITTGCLGRGLTFRFWNFRLNTDIMLGFVKGILGEIEGWEFM